MSPRWAQVTGLDDRAGDEPSSTADAWARRLARGESIAERVALVVAHADDETLWAGSALGRFTDLLIVHATDGAPRDMRDADGLGIASRSDYAAIRAAELDRALALLDVMCERRAYGIVDQESALHLPALVDRLVDDLAVCALVLTHPYEGGHPDHDTLALAVRMAVDRLARRGAAPAIVEFACYHAVDGERRFGQFLADPAAVEHRRTLSPSERRRIDAAIAAHQSQAGVVGGWRPDAERWRAAPAYDFASPPPPGGSLYDGFGWTMTSPRWRDLARAALAQEGALACP